MWIDGKTAARFLADERLALAMMHAAMRLLDELAAEDAVATARVSVLTSFSVRPRDVDNFVPYAIASATNAAYRMVNARRRESTITSEVDVFDRDDPVESLRIDMVDEQLRLADCLARLRADRRMALILYAQGLPWATIALHLGRPAATVRDWLPATRAQLKACLERGHDA